MTDTHTADNRSARIGKLFGKEKMIELVKQVVSNYYNTVNHDFSCKSRLKENIKLKYVAIFIVKKCFPLIPLQTIGEHFGNMDHSSVLYAVRKVQTLVTTEKTLKKEVEELNNILEARSMSLGNDGTQKDNIYYLDLNEVTALRINNGSGIVFSGISKALIEEIKQKYFSEPKITVNDFKNTGLFILEKFENDNPHKGL